MVNGTVDKNNTSSTSKPDEETVKQPRKSKAEVDASSSTASETPKSRKSSISGVSSETDNEKAGIRGEEVGSRAMAEVPTKTSLFCSVPLNKIRSVLSNTACKTDEDENSSKFTQISRKLLCLYCDRTFVSSNLRQKHVERCHSEKQSRRLSSRKLQSQFTTTACFHCDKLPDEHSLSQLFEHLISEHSQKYFGCLLCEERFLNQTQLNDHNTKLHHSTKKEHQKIQPAKVNERSDKNDKSNKTFNSKTEESKEKEQKSSKSKVKKKRDTTNSKPPPRQLRNKKKVSIKASKVGLKRSTRLQSARNKVPVRKKRTKAVETSKTEENNIKTVEKTKSTSINPYPEFDNYYRVKKITDHSIDNLKISSLTFDDVFDKAFFNRIKCNIQENLLHHLDGKLFKNEESESRISNFEKNPPAQEVSSTSSENFGCDLSLNAITPVTSILTANFGEDLESQIEYGSKPSKKKLQIRQDPVRHKYVTRRKYQASILEHKENRDLSKLDMWTQLVIKDRQQKVLNCKKSAKEMLEYTTCDEYKLKIQRNELNRILDRRGPFEDLKEEASKKAALEKLNSESTNEISEACFREVRCLMDDLLAEVVKICSDEEDEPNNIGGHNEIPEYLNRQDMPELPDYLNLRRTSSVPTEEEIDKSDKIALICSSQETENYELPTNTVRNKNEMVELSGEWARSRIYVCAACGLKVPNMKHLIDHKSMYHQNSWVQHYELVGNQSELYRHLCIPGLGKVGHIEETVSCKSWLKSESRVCTKCGKVCNSLSELHRHILECGGDWTWMLARKKCKYRPFGARKKRRGLVKRIRVSNQKTDQTEKKKYKKTFEGPRQRPSDADTIQRMLANLPPKRSSRKSICMKDGFTRKRQQSPKNKKQVMKCGKIVRQKSTYNTNLETSKNPKNKSTSVRQTLRSISRTLSSKILDTNSKLKVKRQMIQNINRRSPRKNSKQGSESSDQVAKNEENEEKIQDNIKTTTSDLKTKKKADLDKVKSVLKEKVNIKSFFPVSKRKAAPSNTKTTENSNSDTCQHAQSNEANKEIDSTKQNTTRNVIKVIKKSFNFNKKVKGNSKNDTNLGTNSEPIVVIEKLPQVEVKPSPSSTTKKAPNKRKLRSSFRKVIDKVKKLKLDNNTATVPNDKNNEINIKPVNSFLGQGAREKEKLATVLVPLVEESKETPVSNLVFVQNAMDNNSPTEESLIPENIFNLQHNSEDLLQAKSPLDTLTNEVRKDEVAKYLNSMSAKVSHIPESKNETTEKSLEINTKNDVKTIEHHTDSYKVEREEDKLTKDKEMSLLSIETSTKSDKSPLVSPILSPSLLSPKMKGKLRKPNRGLNDCIAMLTKKAFEVTHKTETVSDSDKPIEKPKCLDNTNEAHKVVRANECILKIPVIESHSQIQSEVLDLSKPKSNIEPNNVLQKTLIDLPTPRSVSLWNPVNDILSSNQSSSKDDSNILWPILSSKIQTTKVKCNTEKPILKIPKIAEISRSNNVDNIIQGVIENYDEPVTNSEISKPCLKVPSILVLNSVDEIIEEVVKGNLTLPLNEDKLMVKAKSTLEEKSTLKDDKVSVPNNTSRSKKATRKNRQNNKSSNKDKTSVSPPDTSAEPKDQPESLNTVASDSTPIESSKPVERMEDGELLIVSPTEKKATEEAPKSVESDSAALIDEKIPLNSEIPAEMIVNADSISSKKKTGKKVGQGKKGTSKKAGKNTNPEMRENVKEVAIDEKISIQNSTEIPSSLPVEEAGLCENDPISSKVDGIILEKPTTTSSFPNSVIITESSKSLEEDSPVQNNLEEISKESPASIEDNENEEISVNTVSESSSTLTAEEDKASEEISDEKNFNSNATDSEDELPLLILKSRSTKPSLKDIQEESIGKNEITVEKEAASASLEVEDLNSENVKDQTEITINEDPSNTAITENSSAPKENDQISLSDSSSEKEQVENNLSIVPNKRTSPRKALDTNKPKQEKSCKKPGKANKSKQSKIKNNKNSDEISKKDEVLGNISKTVEIGKAEECCTDDSEKEKLNNVSIEKSSEPLMTVEKLEKTEIITPQCCADRSDVEEIKNIPIEENVSPKPSSPLEVQNKPKNFLVDTNVCNYINNITNTSAPLIKPSKTKKKNKNRQDSIKTKLIFKFPKIILKEPILRIPPRDNTSEGVTAFGPTSEENKDQDKSIKLILENPFSNTKILDDKLSPISTVSESLGKSTKSETPLKIKSSNKKKSNKHKKRLLKSLAREGNLLDITTDDFQNEVSNKTESSSFADENHISVEENFQTPPDDSNIPSASENPTKTSTDSFPEFTELQNDTSETPKKFLPITLKLTPNPLKKSKSKNSKRKKDKVKKSSFDPDIVNIVEKVQANDGFSHSNDTHILSCGENITDSVDNKELPPPSYIAENTEESTISKSGNDIEFENKIEHTSTPEFSHKTFVFTSQQDQEKVLESQSDYSKCSTVSSTEKIEAVNEGTTTPKTGRSLRSTVKITYKQSNIFALQIEDKEISDLKIIEKPRTVEPQNDLSDNFSKIQDINPNINEENGLQHEGHIPSKEDSLLDSLKQGKPLGLNKKRSNIKKVKNNHQEEVTQNEKLEETLFSVSDQVENEEKSKENENTAKVEDYSELDLFEKQDTVKGVKAKSKKSRRSSKAKKLSNKILDIDSTIGTEYASVIEKTTDNKKNEDQFLNEANTENEKLEEIIAVMDGTESMQDIMKEKELDTCNDFSAETQEMKQLDDPVNTSGKYEDLSFSEGELVINESFESMESNLFEESIDDKKLEVVTPDIINSIQENIPKVPIPTFCVIEQNKSQKSKKHKKEKSAKFPKNSNSINNSSKTVEADNLDELQKSSAEINEISSDKSITKMELPNSINQSAINDSKLSDVNVVSSKEENVAKPKDEFEFEEEIEPIDDLKSKFKSKKIKDVKPKEIGKFTSLPAEKVEETTSTFLSSTIDMQKVPLDVTNGRRQRTAKSKALESINIIEKKFDQLLDTELLNKEKTRQKNKTTKNKESTTDNKTDNTKGMIFEEPLDNGEFQQTSNVTPLRKSRAAKAKAIENIKVSEIKTSDTEEVNEIAKNTSTSESNEKIKRSSKSKEKKPLNIENNARNLLNHRNNLFGVEENKNTLNKISSVSSELFPSTIDDFSKEVPKSTNETKITEMKATQEKFDLEKDLPEKIMKNISVKRVETVFKNCNKDETITPLIENNKPSKSSQSKLIKEKSIGSESKIDFPSKDERDDINSSSFNTSLSDLSKELPYGTNIYQKRKRGDTISGDIESIEKTNGINAYDIDNIDKDSDFHSKRSSFSASKKKKKSHKNDKKGHNDIKEKLRESHTEKTVKKSDVPEEKNVLDTELVDSLDVTLKTTVDEISSILMEDKIPNEIQYFGNLKENTPVGSEEKEHDKNYCVDDLLSVQKPHRPSEKSSKNKKNKEDIENSPLKFIEKSPLVDMDETVESGSKRRSRRACKVNTYNENILAEAVFDQVKSDKDKADKKRSDETTCPSTNSTIKKTISDEVIPGKKLNSDELFDLLKTTAPDNLIALKPVEENPSDTPHTDDNFDDEFDDILRKSQALFGEKPYKKLDDISRFDDSSSTTSKLTDFEKLDENSESNIELRKPGQSYTNDTAFGSSIIPVSKNEVKKSEEHMNAEDLYCGICKKTFKRIDNLIKHRTTLTHIAKLSEMEAKEAQNKSIDPVPGVEDSCSSIGASVDLNRPINSSTYSYPSNTENNALKIAEIITEAFEKPNIHPDQGFPEMVTPMQEYRRYKSLGERKSFEYDQGSPNISENLETNSYEPNISNNAGVMLEKQINLLQNIVGFDCANDASMSSYHSLGNSMGRDSPVSVFSSKLEDSTNLVFPNDMDIEGESERRSKDDDFLKPPQIEDISEDSINLRNSEDVKSRKVLNRDEELFLECCSLLKSGSEVSNFSKKSNRNSLLNNVSIKMAEEPDVLETKNVIYKVTEDSSDYSRRATPLGDSFGDTSNSNTISSSWETNKNDLPHRNQENPFNFCDVETHSRENSFSSSKFNELVSVDAVKSSSTKNRKSTDPKISCKAEGTADNSSSKMPTKGALKTFEGLKVSIPTDELNLDMLKKKSSANREKNVTQKGLSEQQFVSPKTPRRKSKPVKNKPQIDDRFIFKVNKKPSLKDAEETNPNISKESINDKITDVYDFEETQDNTDVFAKPDFKSFRTKGTEAVKGEVMLENSYEIQNMSSSSSSTFSGKKTNECITKKKHMIMGRIFKNAVKPKLEEEIRDIPPIDHNELVENYVMSCTPKPDEEFKKPKMTEEEMNFLFDKLLDKPIEQPKRSGSPSKTDCKNTAMKKKLKMKCKKRQRSNSDSTDDEFGLNKIVKKRPSRKNAKEEDNSINLEQELKECIGVASRKSQRKCTSGKQNVLVEYWSSDESAFETFLENHLQELSEKTDIPPPKDVVEDKRENLIAPAVPKENPTKNPTSEKNKKPRTKHKVFTKKKESKDPSTSNETAESSVQSTNRRKRTAAHPLYHWSSSSEDELQDLIEVKSIRDDPEDEYDEERPVQHGWIVGDSPKKLVTMLAQAKGKKTEPESFVKEQGKKKNSNS